MQLKDSQARILSVLDEDQPIAISTLQDRIRRTYGDQALGLINGRLESLVKDLTGRQFIELRRLQGRTESLGLRLTSIGLQISKDCPGQPLR